MIRLAAWGYAADAILHQFIYPRITTKVGVDAALIKVDCLASLFIASPRTWMPFSCRYADMWRSSSFLCMGLSGWCAATHIGEHQRVKQNDGLIKGGRKL